MIGARRVDPVETFLVQLQLHGIDLIPFLLAGVDRQLKQIDPKQYSKFEAIPSLKEGFPTHTVRSLMSAGKEP
jgi:hypothetical protein